MRRKKVHCQNCGTTVKDEDISCPVCHMVIERSKEELEEREEEFSLKEEFPIGKIIMGIIIIIGIVLTIKGVVEYQNIESCTADDCGLQELFIAGLGMIMIISASIALAKDKRKYKNA